MDWTLFHFLRPYWLLLILPALAWPRFSRHVSKTNSAWQNVIDPHLLPFVLETSQPRAKSIFDKWFFSIFLLLLTLALAGPTIKKAPQQGTFLKAPLIIAVELSPHMQAADLSPTRLKRGLLKVKELLKTKEVGEVGLIAFAGDAHVVVPLTEDHSTLTTLSDALSPDIMPLAGSNLLSALKLAKTFVSNNSAQKILVITSSNIDDSAKNIGQFAYDNNLELILWTFSTVAGAPLPNKTGGFANNSAGDISISKYKQELMTEFTAEKQISIMPATLDNSDIKQIISLLYRELKPNILNNNLSYDQWQDLGPYFLALAMIFFLFGFFIFAEQWWLFGALALCLCPNADANIFTDWFKRDDQQAYEALQNKQEKKAAELYKDEYNKGTSYYKAGMIDEAIEHLSKSNTDQGFYNLGNALAHKNLIKEAIDAYNKALKINNKFDDAKHNKEILEKLLKDQEQKKQPEKQEKQDKKEEEQKENQKQEQEQKEEKEDQQKGENKTPEQKEEAKEEKASPQEKSAKESSPEPKDDADTIYYFDKLEKNNNHYLKRKFLYESRKNLGDSK